MSRELEYIYIYSYIYIYIYVYVHIYIYTLKSLPGAVFGVIELQEADRGHHHEPPQVYRGFRSFGGCNAQGSHLDRVGGTGRVSLHAGSIVDMHGRGRVESHSVTALRTGLTSPTTFASPCARECLREILRKPIQKCPGKASSPLWPSGPSQFDLTILSKQARP